MRSLELVEFYITNVCNLSCNECNRFNNYNFVGHQYWNEYASDIEQWSQRLDIENITIIGGEPTLNPDLELWASNLRRLWPNSNIMIQTNGTYIRPNFSTFWDNYKVSFAISLHDVSTAESILKNWKKELGYSFDTFLGGFIFHSASVIKHNNYFTLSQSNKHESFNICGVKFDHTMFRGRLYKCPSVALFTEFREQFDLRLTDSQHELLTSYSPLTSNCSIDEIDQFIKNRNDPIEQCQLCPSSVTWKLATGEQSTNGLEPDFGTVTYDVIKFYKSRLDQNDK